MAQPIHLTPDTPVVAAAAGSTLSPSRKRLLLATMMVGLASQGLLASAVPPVMAQIAHSLGGGRQAELTAQMMSGIVYLGLVGGGLATGWLLGRIGIRKVLLAALLLFGLSGGAPLLFDTPVELLAGRAIAGFLSAGLAVCCAALVGEVLDPLERPRVIGRQNAAGNITSIAALYLAGLLGQQFGWKTVFLLFPACAALALALAAPSVPAMPAVRRTKTGGEQLSALIPVAWMFAFMPVMLFLALVNFIQMPFLLQGDGITSALEQSLILGMFTLGSTAASLGYARIHRLIGSNVVPIGLLAVAVGLILAGLMRTAFGAASGATLGGVCVGIIAPFAWQYVIDHTAPDTRGFALGLFSSLMFVGPFLNPPVMTALGGAVGIHGSFAAVGALAVLMAAAGFILTHRQRQSRE